MLLFEGSIPEHTETCAAEAKSFSMGLQTNATTAINFL